MHCGGAGDGECDKKCQGYCDKNIMLINVK